MEKATHLPQCPFHKTGHAKAGRDSTGPVGSTRADGTLALEIALKGPGGEVLDRIG